MESVIQMDWKWLNSPEPKRKLRVEQVHHQQKMLKYFITILLITVGFQVNESQAQCATQLSYTLSPPPVDGQYGPGETVQICASFQFSQNGAIWAHGIVPDIPAGWEMSSLSFTPPSSCSGSGVWGWFNSVTGIASTAGTYGPGIFYDQGNDGNPGNNFGDSGFSCNYTFDFCITLTTTEDCQGLDGSSLDIGFTILGDNASGSWSNTACNPGSDVLSPIAGQSAVLDCCSGEDVSLDVCSSDAGVSLFSSFADTPAGGTWENPSGGAFSGTFLPGSNADGVYTYSFDDGNCAAQSTVEVTTTPAPDAGNGADISTCESGDPFDLNDQIIGGDGNGTWTDPNNNAVTNTFMPGTSIPGTYTYSIGDGIVCPQSQTVVEVTVDPDPFAGDDGALAVCESDPDVGLINFLMNNPEAGGTWTDPAGNPHSGTLSPNSDAEGDYTYTVGTAPCASSAVVTVTIVPLPYAGDDTALNVCANDGTIDLFTLLTGANSGGFWADPNNAGFDGEFTPGVDPDGDYTYQVGGVGCNDVAVVSVTTLPLPQATVVANAAYCEGEDFEVTFELTGTGPFDVVYSVNNIDFNLNGISDGHVELVSATGDAEIEIISVTDSSPESCSSSGNTIDVEMAPTPSASISGGGGICETEDAVLTFELSGLGPFDVVYTDGSQDFTLNGISDGHVENVSITDNTTFTLVSVSGAGASGCEGDVSGSANFAVNEAPSGTISGDAAICLGESTDITFELEGDGPFDVVYSNGAEEFTLTGIDDGHTVSVSPQFLSFYELVSVISQGNPGCPGTTDGSVEVTVSVPPTYNNLGITCNDVNEGYVVTFEINGGNPNTYEVAGDAGTLVGNIFTSDEIPTGAPYTFLLDDGNGCGPVEIEGVHACDCETEAGTMQGGVFEVCSSETVDAVHNNNEILDANDNLIFVLHDSDAGELGNIFAENDTPSFGFEAGMELNTTYYISAVAGNNAAGSVDLDDPCLSVSPGVEVLFIPSPNATISGNGAICPGESATLDIELTGTAPWNIEYALNGTSEGSFVSSDANTTLEVDEGGTYTIVSVSDDVCTGTASGEVDVTEFDPPTAEISGGGNICEGSGDGPEVDLTGEGPWNVTYTIDGANAEDIVIDSSPYTIQASTSGDYVITAVSDANCSGEGSGPVEVTILENPTASISGGGQICEGDLGSINFSGTGNGDIEVTYAIDGDQAGTIQLSNGEATMETGEPGTYTIEDVDDDFCSGSGDGSTAALVVNPIPNAELNLTPTTICEGDSALLSIEMTGNGPFNLVYSNGDEMVIDEGVAAVNQYIQPANGQEINLISIEDSSDPACSQNLDENIVAEVLPVPNQPTLTDIFRCNNDSFPNIGVVDQAGLNYNWSPETGLSNPDTSNPLLVLQNNTEEEQTYTYTLTVGNGTCSVQNSMEVTINPGPQVDFGYSPNPVTTDAPTVNFYNQTPGSNNYEWLIDSVSVSEQTNFIYSFPEGIEGKYFVELVAEDPETGCFQSMGQIVEVKGELQVYVPNAFTPDGDGINDLFAPVVRNHRPGIFEFKIFNRQGELVFQSASPDQKWDGSEPAGEYFVQDGVYVWVLNVGDLYSATNREYTGSVTVIR